MEYLFLLGRVLYGGFFLFAGFGHFGGLANMAPYAASKGVPFPEFMVVVTGVMLVLGGLSILLGLKPHWGVALLVVFLVPTTFIMHNFWADTDPGMKQVNQIMFLKNTALLGAALMLLMVPRPWPRSLDR